LPGPPHSYSTAQNSAFLTVLGTLARTTKGARLTESGQRPVQAPNTQLFSLFWTRTRRKHPRRQGLSRSRGADSPALKTQLLSMFCCTNRPSQKDGEVGPPPRGAGSAENSAFTNVSNQCGEHALLPSTAGRYNIDLSNDTMLRHGGDVH